MLRASSRPQIRSIAIDVSLDVPFLNVKSNDMAIDPLFGLGVAVNVVQFMYFAAKFIGESRKIYKSASPASEDHINLDTVAHDVHHFSDSIFAPEGCSDAFKIFTDDTKRISQELLNMLEKLRVTNYYIS